MSEQTSNQVGNTALAEIANAIGTLKFGSVEITVHEGRVTQIEKREKVRFNENNPTALAAAKKLKA